MRENLHHAVHRIGPKQCARCAVNDFDFVHTLEIVILEFDRSSRLIHRNAVHEKLREIGIPAIQKKRRHATLRSKPRKRSAGRRRDQRREPDFIPLGDVLLRDDVHRCCRDGRGSRFGRRRHHHIRRQFFERQPCVPFPRFSHGQREGLLRALECRRSNCHAIAPRRQA